ncbi:MAG TPA: hypothetical protein VE505_14085, partial [Vicinamibacterales bacterium]|nr:hypothetical protein [Vicinamibacterales bacterium]
MIGIFRQVAATALAVMIASAFPLAQGSAPVSQPGSPAAAAPVAAPAAPAPAAAAAPPANPADADQTRTHLLEMLNRHPPSLGDVLRLDPTLLTNADYLAPYPELA